jgi:hypothetical protein
MVYLNDMLSELRRRKGPYAPETLPKCKNAF